MHSAINIGQDDILWKFYCKYFEINKRELEHPKSLCNYFWISVGGFGLWLGREIKLRKIWLAGFVCYLAIIGIDLLNPDKSSAFYLAPTGLLAIVGSVMLTAAILISAYRLKETVERRAPWVMYVFVICFIAGAMISMAMKGVLWAELKSFFDQILGFRDMPLFLQS